MASPVMQRFIKSDDVVNDRRVPFESPQPPPEAARCGEPTLHQRFLNWWKPWRQIHNFPHDDRALEDAWIAGFSEHNQITCAVEVEAPAVAETPLTVEAAEICAEMATEYEEHAQKVISRNPSSESAQHFERIYDAKADALREAERRIREYAERINHE